MIDNRFHCDCSSTGTLSRFKKDATKAASRQAKHVSSPSTFDMPLMTVVCTIACGPPDCGICSWFTHHPAGSSGGEEEGGDATHPNERGRRTRGGSRRTPQNVPGTHIFTAYRLSDITLLRGFCHSLAFLDTEGCYSTAGCHMKPLDGNSLNLVMGTA